MTILSIAILFYRQQFCFYRQQFCFYQQPLCSMDSHSVILISNLFYQQPFCSIESQSLFYQQKICSIENMFLMIEQWQIYLNYNQRMGMLPLKNCKSRDKCVCWGSSLSMRSFTIETAPSPFPALYATTQSPTVHLEVFFPVQFFCKYIGASTTLF